MINLQPLLKLKMATVAALSYFLPILSFLLVFVLVYALLKKTEILGESEGIMLLISFILAVFFIVEASLVDFINFSSAWFVVFLVCVFMILLMIGFLGKDALGVITGNKWVAWVMLVALIVFFIISSAYTFNWAVNWETVWDWAYTDWFGMVLLLIVAGVVSWVLAKK